MIGIGNVWRGDDAVGLEVARRLRRRLPEGVEVVEREGEPAALIDSWEAVDAVWIVDACFSGAPGGTVHRFDAAAGALPAELGRGSTHLLGLPEAVELARALGRLPAAAVVYCVEGTAFAAGAGLTPAVEAAAEEVAEAVRKEVEACSGPYSRSG